MSNRKSYFENFPTSTLFVVLEQNMKELSSLELNPKTNEILKKRMEQVELVVSVSRAILVNRYLQDNISLTKIARLVLESEGIRKSVYREVFTLRILEKDEIISFELLEKTINELDISEIMLIMKNRDSIYKELAIKRYDEIIFDVESEVYEELIIKKRLDWRG